MSGFRLCTVLAAFAGLSLTACHPVGPDYHVPDAALVNAPTATGGFVGANQPSVTTQEGTDRWWMLFTDERLNGLVQQALTANTDLRVAAANISRADAALAVAEDARLPQTQINAGFEYGQIAGEEYLQPRSPPAGGLYDTGATVAYQIDLFGQISRSIEAAKADRKSVV